MKDLIISTKDDTIKKNAEKIGILSNENKELKKELENQSSVISCKSCQKTFKAQFDLNEHMISNHPENSKVCLNCKANNQKLENAKCLVSRLQGMTRSFMDDKKRHKEMCDEAAKCCHEMMCPQTCYFTDSNYVEFDEEESNAEESNEEKSDNDNFASDEETECSSLSKTNKMQANNKCSTCNFEAKNRSGLKLHMSKDHKIKCSICGFKTTTDALLKKHKKEFHIFLIKFPFIGPSNLLIVIICTIFKCLDLNIYIYPTS